MPQRSVYFVRSPRFGLVKIGSANDPETRVNALQTGSPDVLELVGSLPEYTHSGATEPILHKRFDSLRSHGEWFREEGELKEFTTALESGDFPALLKITELESKVQSVEDLASLVRLYRNRAGLTQLELAERVGTSRKWIVDVERGNKGVRIGLVFDVVRELEIPIGLLKTLPLLAMERMQIAAEMSKL